MKIHIRAFAISFSIVMIVLIAVITVWARTSARFGGPFMELFNSVHPHPFAARAGELSILEHVYGVGLDLFYTLVDSLIFSLALGTLYNWVYARLEGKGEPRTALDIEEDESGK